MIEQVMIFVLGACVAGLLALLCLPAITRRAMRIAQTTVERQMPISVDEIIAQRDLLRAEFAADRRRIEQVLERTREAHAHEMSEAGRRAADVGRIAAELAGVVAARDLATGERDTAQRSARETDAENAALQKALFDADSAEERWRERHAEIVRERDRAHAAEAEKAQLVADLRLDQGERMAAAAAMERDLMQAKLDLSISRAREAAMAAQIDGHEEALRTALARESDLRRRLGEAEQARNGTDDLAMLRNTIVEIGREVVRMAETGRLETGRPELDRPESLRPEPAFAHAGVHEPAAANERSVRVR